MTSTAPVTERNKVKQIDAQSVSRWMNEGGAMLIDVREPDEHAREHIPGATLMPLSKFDPSQVSANGRKIVLHCQSGRRSLEAASRLASAGHCDVHSLEGGIEQWRSSGLSTQINHKAPIPIMRQVQIAAGSLILIGTLLGAFVSPWWLILSGFVGAGLVFAGISGFCGMATMLAKLPFNRVALCKDA